MNNKHIKYILAVLLLGCSASLSAQTLNSGYFLESNAQRNELNPAFDARNNYIVLPAFGGIQVGVHSNVGLGNFFFPSGNDLYNGLSSKVSAEEFLGNLPNNSRLEFSFSLPILSVGFRALGGFNTIILKERSFISANIPSTLFEFLKVGQNSPGVTHYDVDNLSLYTDNYVEIALGHQRKLDALEGFSYGAKLKFLIGALGGSLSIDHLGIDLTQNEWRISAQGQAQMSSGLGYAVNEEGVVNNITFDSYSLGGFGFGVDLGAAYTSAALPDLTVSLALTDLGFISWSNMAVAKAEGSFVYDGLGEIGSSDASTQNQFEALIEDLMSVVELRPAGIETRTTMLQTTLNVGAEYSILKRAISFGLLSSTRFGAPEVYAEGMAVVNFRPLSWLHMAINGSVSTYGGGLGAIINFCPRVGVTTFIGCDYFSPSTKFGAQGIPVNAFNMTARAGFTVVW